MSRSFLIVGGNRFRVGAPPRYADIWVRRRFWLGIELLIRHSRERGNPDNTVLFSCPLPALTFALDFLSPANWAHPCAAPREKGLLRWNRSSLMSCSPRNRNA